MPALLDELERVRLDLALAQHARLIDDVRAQITAEEAQQHHVQRAIDARTGELRREVERLTAEIGRLETRLDRLAFSRRALTDSELDDDAQSERAEEAAFWATWREQREERRNPRANGRHDGAPNHRPRAEQDVTLRQLFRALARLIHPDLARDPADKARREGTMRVANAAHDAKDVEQLRRLLLIWSKPETGARLRDIDALRARLADRNIEYSALKRQLRALKLGFVGALMRKPGRDLERHIKREEERLRREMATLRLRRRRLTTTLDERRRELTEVSD